VTRTSTAIEFAVLVKVRIKTIVTEDSSLIFPKLSRVEDRARTHIAMSLPLTPLPVPVSLIAQIKRTIRRKLRRATYFTMGQAQSRNTRPAPAAMLSAEKLAGTVALGAGCYWGTEKYIKKNFQANFPGSVKSCSVGFMSPLSSPKMKKPTYQQVCRGTSGHIEVLLVELNEPETHFEELIRFFFQFHDPTTKNRQGNDSGFQYASWIFCADEAQTAIATRVKDQLQAAINQGKIGCYEKKEITTQITPLTEFTKAQSEHQAYLEKHPNGYCNHRIRLKEWVDVSQ
jgi:peptide-methionine (S)-S-oxide reductase